MRVYFERRRDTYSQTKKKSSVAEMFQPKFDLKQINISSLSRTKLMI